MTTSYRLPLQSFTESDPKAILPECLLGNAKDIAASDWAHHIKFVPEKLLKRQRPMRSFGQMRHVMGRKDEALCRGRMVGTPVFQSVKASRK
ncbi:hypothetical protein E4U48_004570 [Claviceps purpurea]|nr:hypothetical protein E4U48_004570 [Claviceps purpurea]